MKIKSCSVVILISLQIATCFKSNAQNANTTLSNLTSPTAVNVNLLPDKDIKRDLGSANKSWKNFYLDSSVYLGGARFIAYATGTGTFNTAIGAAALNANTTGFSNTGVGFNALFFNTEGYENTAYGYYSLYANTSGHANTAFGTSALDNNTTGLYNTAIGYRVMAENKSGSANVAIGSGTMYANTTGGNNTATGPGALSSNTIGNNNTGIGDNAGANVIDGSNNTFLGAEANSGTGGHLTNATAIGFEATVTVNNHIHIGNSSVTSIGGQVSWTSFSDERIKNNIQENVPGLPFINLLKPVTYHFNVNIEDNLLQRKTKDWQSKYDIEKIQFTGFLGQDVEAAAKKIGYDFS